MLAEPKYEDNKYKSTGTIWNDDRAKKANIVDRLAVAPFYHGTGHSEETTSKERYIDSNKFEAGASAWTVTVAYLPRYT